MPQMIPCKHTTVVPEKEKLDDGERIFVVCLECGKKIPALAFDDNKHITHQLTKYGTLVRRVKDNAEH